MKKLANLAFVYGIAALGFGVFYREVTKFMDFDGVTTLSVIHTHLFAMGMLVFLILLALEAEFKLSEHKKYKLFLTTYNVGLIAVVTMLLVRGMTQVMQMELSKAADASIAGISGLGHATFGFAIVLMLLIIKKQVALTEK